MNKKKLILLYGPPGAGKTTLAKHLATKDPEHVIVVSRDKLRDSLGVYWVESRERFVKELEQLMVKHALSSGYSVILDNTNVDYWANRNWRVIAEMYDAEFDFVPVMLSKDECKVRNRCKGRKFVPEEFIDLWFATYVNNDGSLKSFEELKDCPKI